MTKFAFVFPGQGSQTSAMLANMAEVYPIVKKTFNEASNVLNYDLWELVQNSSVKELSRTRKVQPALLAASVSLWRIWQYQGGEIPSLMAGHSLGEYSALVCAGVIEFSDAVYLLEIRGKFMEEAVPKGTGAMMAVLGLDDTLILKICEEFSEGQVVSPVNFNAPGQVVISGHKEAVERAGKACKSAGAKRLLPLPIIVPSHCVLMRPAAKRLAVELEKISFNKPKIPIINNVDVRCETTPEAIRYALVRQLYNPVKWTKIIEFIFKQNINFVYEIGPGKVLTNLTKRIINEMTVSEINEPDILSKIIYNIKSIK